MTRRSRTPRARLGVAMSVAVVDGGDAEQDQRAADIGVRAFG